MLEYWMDLYIMLDLLIVDKLGRPMINKMNDSKNTSMSCVNGYNWTVILFCCESPTDRYRLWDCFVVSCNWKEQFHQQIKIRWLTMCLDCCWFGLQWLGCLWNFFSCRSSVVSSVFCGCQRNSANLVRRDRESFG